MTAGRKDMAPCISEPQFLFAVGSYTEPYGDFRAQGKGVSLIGLSSEGILRRISTICLPNPSYLRHSKNHGRIYAAIETLDSRAALVSLELHQPDLSFSLSAQASINGRLPCHIDLHPRGRWIATACYGTGEVFVKGLTTRGDLDRLPGHETRRTGSGPHPVRQTRSHPHGAYFSPDGRWLLVPDLGTDEVAAYPFDTRKGTLGTPRTWLAPPGTGPRTVAFSKCGRHAVLVSELSSEVSWMNWQDGIIDERVRVSSRDPANLSKRADNTAAGLRMHPDGIHFGVTNRGDDSISIFRMNADAMTLQRQLTIPSGGKKPRDFGFSPCGGWLVSVNQDSDNCVLFKISLMDEPRAIMTAETVIRSPCNVCFAT